jgi:O-antigen ligase
MKLLKQLYNPLLQKEIVVIACISMVVSLVWWPLLNSIVGAFIFGFWLLFCKKEFSVTTKQGKLMLLLMSLYCISLIGFFYSSNVEEAMFKVQQKSALALFPLVFGTANLLTPKDVTRILQWFSLAVFFMCIFFLGNGIIFYFKTGSTAQLHGYELNSFKQATPVTVAVFCLFAAIFHLYCATFQQYTVKNRSFWLHMAVVFFYTGFLFLFGNRMTLLLLCISFPLFIVKQLSTLNHKLSFLALFATFIVVAAITNPSLKKQLAEFGNLSQSSFIQLDSDSSLGKSWGGIPLRVAIWNCSWGLVQKKWITGVGTGDVQDELQSVYEQRKFYFASRFNRYNAHNQYLEQILANGIMGFILLALCIAVPLFRYLYRKNTTLLYPIFLIIFAFICCSESFLEINKGIVWYSFFNSIFVFSENQTRLNI